MNESVRRSTKKANGSSGAIVKEPCRRWPIPDRIVAVPPGSEPFMTANPAGSTFRKGLCRPPTRASRKRRRFGASGPIARSARSPKNVYNLQKHDVACSNSRPSPRLAITCRPATHPCDPRAVQERRARRMATRAKAPPIPNRTKEVGSGTALIVTIPSTRESSGAFVGAGTRRMFPSSSGS